jgi:hypothetical protein
MDTNRLPSLPLRACHASAPLTISAVLLVDATSTGPTDGESDVDGLDAETGAGRDHRRLAGVDGGDDLGVVDPL